MIRAGLEGLSAGQALVVCLVVYSVFVVGLVKVSRMMRGDKRPLL